MLSRGVRMTQHRNIADWVEVNLKINLHFYI